MTHRLVIPLVALVAFGAGYGARVWMDRDPVLPAPPAPGSEFVRKGALPTPETKPEAKPASNHGPDRAKMVADIQKMRTQIDAYHTKQRELDADFNQQFVAVLTPDQRAIFDSRQKKMAEGRERTERASGDTTPLSDEQILLLQQMPLYGVLWSVAVNARLERLTKDYKLTEGQVPKVKDLLLARRVQFLDLVDATAPPSIRLSELARQTQKLGEAPKK